MLCKTCPENMNNNDYEQISHTGVHEIFGSTVCCSTYGNEEIGSMSEGEATSVLGMASLPEK